MGLKGGKPAMVAKRSEINRRSRDKEGTKREDWAMSGEEKWAREKP